DDPDGWTSWALTVGAGSPFATAGDGHVVASLVVVPREVSSALGLGVLAALCGLFLVLRRGSPWVRLGLLLIWLALAGLALAWLPGALTALAWWPLVGGLLIAGPWYLGWATRQRWASRAPSTMQRPPSSRPAAGPQEPGSRSGLDRSSPPPDGPGLLGS